MKTTAKEYQAKFEEKREMKNLIEHARMNNDWSMVEVLEQSIKMMQAEYFSKLPTVKVSFMIGSRSYFEEVVKIGKAYFNNGRKMTKSRGYYCVEEIPEITKEMQESMLADSYYY